VRIGVIGDGGIDRVEHTVGDDAVEIKSDDHRHVLAEDLAALLQQIAFGVDLVGRAHRAVHREEGGIDGRGVPDPGQELVGNLAPGVGGEGAIRGDRPGAKGADELGAGFLEDGDRATGFGAETVMEVDDLLAGVEDEVAVVAGIGVEGRDFLPTLGNQDAHGGTSQMALPVQRIVNGIIALRDVLRGGFDCYYHLGFRPKTRIDLDNRTYLFIDTCPVLTLKPEHRLALRIVPLCGQGLQGNAENDGIVNPQIVALNQGALRDATLEARRKDEQNIRQSLTIHSSLMP
jgi:hypothetical protein